MQGDIEGTEHLKVKYKISFQRSALSLKINN